jgi:hypothetical protein
MEEKMTQLSDGMTFLGLAIACIAVGFELI